MDKPLITFALVAFNQERYIREAVKAALAQQYSPLELILSDDKSSDGTWAIIHQMAEQYQGPHRVIVNRNSTNIGTGAHINAIMSMAKGELIVIAAGDDISCAERTEQTYRAWEHSGRKAMSITSHIKKIDEEGRGIGEFRASINPASRRLLHRVRHGCWNVQGCAHAWHRKVFEQFGPLQNYVVAEDRAIEFRSLALGEVVVVDDYLVQYRVHGSNLAALAEGATSEERLRNSVKINGISYAMFQQFLVDLDCIETLGLSSAGELRQARRVVHANLVRLLMEKQYLEAAHRPRRIFLGIKAALTISPKIGLKWIFRSGASR